MINEINLVIFSLQKERNDSVLDKLGCEFDVTSVNRSECSFSIFDKLLDSYEVLLIECHVFKFHDISVLVETSEMSTFLRIYDSVLIEHHKEASIDVGEARFSQLSIS